MSSNITLAFSVSPVNDAPEIDDSLLLHFDPTLEGIASLGITVYEIFLSDPAGNTYFDADGDSGGIAITSVDESNGVGNTLMV